MGMNIGIIGTGYVGLVTAVCFAKFGHNVICVDKDETKVQKLLAGEIPIYEPGLDVLLDQVKKAGKISFTTDTAQGVKNADIVMLAVGTPTDVKNKRVDLSYVYAAAEHIALHLKSGAVVVTKSTVPVGTSREVQRIIKTMNPSLEFSVASNPEFLREGSAIADFMKPERIVIGADNRKTLDKVTGLYQVLVQQSVPVVAVGLESSELIKYTANALLATKVAFINEIADLAEKCGANITDVVQGVGLDARIGNKFLNPGPGYGGSCFPKDAQGLATAGSDHHVHMRIIEAVISSNTQRKRAMAQKVAEACGGGLLGGKTIAVLGLAFKAETDDMRDAASIDILNALHQKGAQLRCYDPKAMMAAKEMLPFIDLAEDAYSAIKGADAAVILTEWPEFRDLALDKVYSLLKKPLVIDLRNIFDPAQMKQHGFHYVSVGRADILPQMQEKLAKHA